MSAPDAINAFIEAMEAEGVHPIEPIADRLTSGELIRFRCDQDSRGRQNGWAILYLDARPAGAFGNYRLGVSRRWKSGDDRKLTPTECEALKREWADAKQRRLEDRQRLQAAAANNAQATWKSAPAATAAHPYVLAKQLDPSPLRQLAGLLLVPLHDTRGQIWNLQSIAGDGSKRFLRGGRTEGLGCLIGYKVGNPDIFCIGEGYATMAAVHRATGYPCLATFSAHNMAPAARIYSAARPEISYIVCADNDAQLNTNVGLRAAEATAREIRAKLAVSPLAGDFDDVARQLGLNAVCEAIRGAQ